MDTTLKKCSICNIEKQLSEFRKSKNSKFGVHAYCKICQNVKSRISYEKNKEKRLKQVIEWNTKNSEKLKKYKRIWYEKKNNIISETPSN